MEALPHAIVFDMDGTLTDSEEEWDVVRRGLAAADGVPWPEGATQAMMGMSTREWSTYLVEAADLPPAWDTALDHLAEVEPDDTF